MKNKWEREFEKEYLKQKDRYWAIMGFSMAVTGLLAIGLAVIMKML